MGEDTKAIQFYQKFLKLDPNNIKARTNLAICLERKGLSEKAIFELNSVVNSGIMHDGRDMAKVLNNLGVI